jgi:hypothetical protein
VQKPLTISLLPSPSQGDLGILRTIEACPRPQGADRPAIEVLVDRFNSLAHLWMRANPREIMGAFSLREV